MEIMSEDEDNRHENIAISFRKGPRLQDLQWFRSNYKMGSWTGAKKMPPQRWGDGVCDEFLNTFFFQYDAGE